MNAIVDNIREYCEKCVSPCTGFGDTPAICEQIWEIVVQMKKDKEATA
jgi:hypothetical protein